jgi:hypothetical protein
MNSEETEQERVKRLIRTPFNLLSKLERLEVTLKINTKTGIVSYVVSPISAWQEWEAWGIDPRETDWMEWVEAKNYEEFANNSPLDIRPMLVSKIEKIAEFVRARA